MTLQSLRAIALYHRSTAADIGSAVATLACDQDAAQIHAEMLMHLRNRQQFHQDAAEQLTALAAAFETFGQHAN